MISDRELVERLGKAGVAFFGSFRELHEVQRVVIPLVLAGCDVLACSPTASGKTEAVIAPMVANLLRSADDGIKLLAVAPTRALVNDLYERLDGPTRAVGWHCGRQTSDHADKRKEPQILITTPESFDSMLVRDGQWVDGELGGHLLAKVEGVFIDEAHVLEHSARGRPCCMLVSRLRKLRDLGLRRAWSQQEQLQVCSASATVAEPDRLAKQILGEGGQACVCPGQREMEFCLGQDQLAFYGADCFPIPSELYPVIPRASASDLDSIAKLVWGAMGCSEGAPVRKLLIFVRSRQMCDELSAHLRAFFRARRAIYVGGHHASLSRDEREAAESAFSLGRDAVMVATTTLELGIDIGDVDLAVLVGPPPDTNSLLQRVGRAGRRVGKVRVLPIALSEMEARAFMSELEAAGRGALDSRPTGRRWSVFIQQAASMIAQAKQRGCSRDALVRHAEGVWPEDGPVPIAASILDGLVERGILVTKGERLILGDELADRLSGPGGGGFHANFSGSEWGIPVLDSATGEVVANVAESEDEGAEISLAGRYWTIRFAGDELIVEASNNAMASKSFRYNAKRAYLSKSFAAHVRRGCGFEAAGAPVLHFEGRDYWFHFGGAAYEFALKSRFPSLSGIRGLVGIVVHGAMKAEPLREAFRDARYVAELVRPCSDDLAKPLDPGKHHAALPGVVRADVGVALFGVEEFVAWVQERALVLVEEGDPRYQALVEILRGAAKCAPPRK